MSAYNSSFIADRIGILVDKFKLNPLSITQYLQELFIYIEQHNPKLNALTSLQKEAAFARANILAKNNAQAHELLYGIPIIIKENIQKIGYPAECASNILNGYVGQYDATVIKFLEQAGAIIIATANMDEFAMGSANEHSKHGPVLNPHDLSRVSGGSSGGPAAACAVGFAPISLGSETGGSVREPAAFCGVFGFKPSYGRVSRFGLVAYGSSLDQISPFARSATDLDLIMQVIAQHDVADATSMPGNYLSELNTIDLTGIKIGVIRSLLESGVDENVLQAFNRLEKQLTQLGVKFVDIEIPSLKHTLSTYYLTACAEASTNLSRFDGIRFGHRAQNTTNLDDLYCKTRAEGFGTEVKLRILLGTLALSSEHYGELYGKAQIMREIMVKEFAQHFNYLDFIYMPTAPSSAFKLGAKKLNPVQEYLCDIFTIPANLTKIPAISVPALRANCDLPVGLQFMAAYGQDARLIAFTHELEKHNLIGTTLL